MTPNLIAYTSLVAWPLVALYLYISRPVAVATIWTILAGQLLLPVGTFFKFEMIPQFDKVSIPNLCALVGCMVMARRRRHASTAGVTKILIPLCIVGPLVTSLLNGDPIYVGSTVLPGVGLYDGISALACSKYYHVDPIFPRPAIFSKHGGCVGAFCCPGAGGPGLFHIASLRDPF